MPSSRAPLVRLNITSDMFLFDEVTDRPTHQRRTSIMSRTRPQTAVMEERNYLDQRRLSGLQWFSPGDRRWDTGEQAEGFTAFEATPVPDTLEEPEHPTTLPLCSDPAHRPSKSFSSFRQGVHELRAVARRMSLSLRARASKQGGESINASNVGLEPRREHDTAGGMVHRSRSTSWFKSSRGMQRKSLNFLDVPNEGPIPDFIVTSPVPGYGSDPPFVPDNKNSGASARAAAAAQNEAHATSRLSAVLSDLRVQELKLSRDSESGIGIDLRDRQDVVEDEAPVIRRSTTHGFLFSQSPLLTSIDPMTSLPAELIAQVLCYLDPGSLLSASMASSSWHAAATSRAVWRHVFRREYGHASSRPAVPLAKAVPNGLGKSVPDQDWKRMYLVRKNLESRWQDGKAAAIYLYGHQDSVYCVQFDEYVSTGASFAESANWKTGTRLSPALGTAQFAYGMRIHINVYG